MRGRTSRLVSILLLISLCIGTIGIINADTTYAASKKIHLKKSTVSINVGKTYQQKLIDKKGKVIKATKVKWKSKKTSVAKINKKGKITAVKAGTAKMTAKYKGKTYKFTVKVKKPVVQKPVERVPDLRAVDFELSDEKYPEGSVTVTIKDPREAEQFEVFVSKDGGEYQLFATRYLLSSGFWIDTEDWELGTYSIKLRGISGNYKGDFSEERNIIIKGNSSLVVTDSSGRDPNSSPMRVLIGEKQLIRVKVDVGSKITCTGNDCISCSRPEITLSGEYYNIDITGIKEGEAVVTIADQRDSAVKTSFTVQVEPLRIDVEKDIYEVEVGESIVVKETTNGKSAYSGYDGLAFVSSGVANILSRDEGELENGDHYENVTIEGVKPGRVTLTFTSGFSSENKISKRITINVVEPSITVSSPSLPSSYSLYKNGNIVSTCTINKIEYKYTYYSYSNKYEIEATFYGEKTFDTQPNTSSSSKVGYKLYDSEGYVVKSGTFYSSAVTPGEAFKESCRITGIESVSPGEYRLELLNVQ